MSRDNASNRRIIEETAAAALRDRTEAARQFPFPVTVFGRDTVRVFSIALDDAWDALADGRSDIGLPEEAIRHTLAVGIVLAATLGARDQHRLSQAALEHLAHSVSHHSPALEPMPAGPAIEGPDRYRQRAEEVRAIAGQTKDPFSRDVLTVVAIDYERIARSLDLIRASRRAASERTADLLR